MSLSNAAAVASQNVRALSDEVRQLSSASGNVRVAGTASPDQLARQLVDMAKRGQLEEFLEVARRKA